MARVILGAALFAAAVAVGLLAQRGGAARDRGPAPAAAAGEADAPRVLELYAPWCPSCRQMRPLVDELAERCAASGVRVLAVDVSREENELIAERWRVDAIPTFLFLDAEGNERRRLVGAQSRDALRRGLEAIGEGACAQPGGGDRAGKEG